MRVDNINKLFTFFFLAIFGMLLNKKGVFFKNGDWYVLFNVTLVFVFLASISIKFIFIKCNHFIRRWLIIILGYPILAFLSGSIGPVTAGLLNGEVPQNFLGFIEALLLGGIFWGFGIGISTGIPIYLIVIYLIYKDHQKNSGET